MEQDAFALEDVTNWSACLRNRGYVVVKGVLNASEVSDAMHAFWGVMEALGSVRKGTANSWSNAKNWPPMLHGGMIQYLGHTPVQWWLRSRCARVFARYYGVEEHALASSFDGLCFMHGARNYEKRGDLLSFLHSDQSPDRPADWSVQGLINLADAGAKDGGLVVIPESHKEHAAFFEKHPKRSEMHGDWYQLTDTEKAPFAKRALKVCAEPGDFLLWDSRTLHCNTVPERKTAIRACSYICMLPKDRVPAHIRVRRQLGWEQRRTSTHHPGDGFRLFPALPRFAPTPREAFQSKVDALQRATRLDAFQASLLCVHRTQLGLEL